MLAAAPSIFSQNDACCRIMSTSTADWLHRAAARKRGILHEFQRTLAQAARRKLLGLEALSFCGGGLSFDPTTDKVSDCVRVSERSLGSNRRYWLRSGRVCSVHLCARDGRHRRRHRRSVARPSKGKASRQHESSLPSNLCKPPSLRERQFGHSSVFGGTGAFGG